MAHTHTISLITASHKSWAQKLGSIFVPFLSCLSQSHPFGLLQRAAQDWVSHELVTFAAAFVLKEWLGYNVELVRLEPLPQRPAMLGSHGIMAGLMVIADAHRCGDQRFAAQVIAEQ